MLQNLAPEEFCLPWVVNKQQVLSFNIIASYAFELLFKLHCFLYFGKSLPLLLTLSVAHTSHQHHILAIAGVGHSIVW